MDRAGVADALAGALVLADLSISKEASAFGIEVARVAKWAEETDDPVVGALAHEIQSTLTALADGATSAAEAATLIGEMISVMLDAAAEPVRANAVAVGMPSSLKAEGAATLPAEGNIYAQDAAVLDDFVTGAREQLDEAEAALSARATGRPVDVDLLFRAFHTLKGIAGFLSVDEMASAAHVVESSLEPIRSGQGAMSDEVIEAALKTVDRIREIVADVDQSRAALPVAKRRAHARTGTEFVRVDAGRLDDLLDAIGELVVAESEVATAVAHLADDRASRSLERLSRIARDMQASATSLRMVGLGPTFRKMTRVVRDMLAKSGKQVEFSVSGAETELDRAIVDGISDPLVHLLRNAIDHGVESPEERLAAGKPAFGNVELRAFHRSGSVHIEVADDGRGVDAERLAAKATSLGIDYDRDDPLSLMFVPGFSTAETVTEISGRGVGMDAVKAAVTNLRGQLDVSSVAGEGTVVSIRLPLTLAVIDGIVMRAADERYVVPTEFVERTVRVSDGEIVSAAGRGDVLVLPDGPVAIYPVTAPMGGALEDGSAAVIVHDGEMRFALRVDEVIGQQSLVIKALSGPVTKATGVAGAALMGDGRAVLVLDPFGMSKVLRAGLGQARTGPLKSERSVETSAVSGSPEALLTEEEEEV